MVSFKESAEPDKHALASYLPWSMLVAPGIIENKDGSWQKSYRFRGPDLDSSTKRDLMGMSGAFNNALRRLSDGWAVFIEAQRNAVCDYPASLWPNAACKAIDDERRTLFANSNDNFANSFFITFLYRVPPKLETKGGSWFIKKEPRIEPRMPVFNSL